MEAGPKAAGKSSFDLIDLDRFFALLDLVPGQRFVDLACGTGRYSLETAKRLGDSGQVHAVDLWTQGIAALDRTIREQSVTNIATHVADISRCVPLAGGSFDACLLAAVLHDLAEEGQEGALREAARLLKPRGILTVVEFKKTADGPGPPAGIRIAEPELERKVTGRGFSLRRCEDLGPFMYLCQFRKA